MKLAFPARVVLAYLSGGPLLNEGDKKILESLKEHLSFIPADASEKPAHPKTEQARAVLIGQMPEELAKLVFPYNQLGDMVLRNRFREAQATELYKAHAMSWYPLIATKHGLYDMIELESGTGAHVKISNARLSSPTPPYSGVSL